MLAAVPRLVDYGISRENGFLPNRAPLRRLPDPYYGPWESIVDNLQALILTQRVRRQVDEMPVLAVDGLIEETEWRRAYLLLGFMAHAYIWNGDKPADVSTPQSLPLCARSNTIYSASRLQSRSPTSKSQSTSTSLPSPHTPPSVSGTGRHWASMKALTSPTSPLSPLSTDPWTSPGFTSSQWPSKQRAARPLSS